MRLDYFGMFYSETDGFIPYARSKIRLDLRELSDADLNEALVVWRQWANERLAPVWSQVMLSDLPPVVLPMTTVMDVIDGGMEYRCRFWGSRLTEFFGRDETGMLLSEHPSEAGRTVRRDQFDEMVRDKSPLLFKLEFETRRNRLMNKYNLRLPVVFSNGELDKILTVSVVKDVGHSA